MRVTETGHVMPTVNYRSEENRIAAVDQFRRDIAAKGGTIIREARVRNPVFDRAGERTTFKFTVRWPA